MDVVIHESEELSFESAISRSLLNHLYEGIYFVDVNRQIKFWNKGAENITGYSKEEIIGHHCVNGKLCHQNTMGENLCVGQCPLVKSITEGIHIDERIYLRHKSGKTIPVWVHVTPIKNVKGEIIGAIEVFLDDSDYEELKQVNSKLEELNEMKNQFLGMAAHDLRTPLSVALSFSTFLLEFHGDTFDQKIQSIIQRINKACKSMLALINDLLDITSIESGKITLEKNVHNIYEIFNLEEMSMKIMADQKNIDIKIDIEPDLPQINVDLARMNQVLENLISNAVKFSYENTTIILKARKENGFVAISVIDQGQGIPEADMPKLFTPFEKTSIKPTGKETSTGLGLVIVKKIVEMHGGTIEVQSVPGEGSEFKIKLPLS